MDFSEKVLYQQIHPAKLAADVSGSLVSTYLMWRRRFAWAMLAAFVPAVVASVLVIAYADYEEVNTITQRGRPESGMLIGAGPGLDGLRRISLLSTRVNKALA
jgi:hypothetical protein